MKTQDSLVLVLRGNAVNGIPSFYDEVNRVFMADEDWKLGHSLDALDDMLYGGYGALAGQPEATVIWQEIEHTRSALGVDITRAWLQAKLNGTGAFNAHAVTAQLQALEAGEGQTYFQIVMDIFAAHPRLKLVR